MSLPALRIQSETFACSSLENSSNSVRWYLKPELCLDHFIILWSTPSRCTYGCTSGVIVFLVGWTSARQQWLSSWTSLQRPDLWSRWLMVVFSTQKSTRAEDRSCSLRVSTGLLTVSLFNAFLARQLVLTARYHLPSNLHVAKCGKGHGNFCNVFSDKSYLIPIQRQTHMFACLYLLLFLIRFGALLIQFICLGRKNPTLNP